MAKGHGTKSRRKGPKKSLLSKKAEIDKLIQAGNEKFASRSASFGPHSSSIQFSRPQPLAPNLTKRAQQVHTLHPARNSTRIEPRQVVSGLPEEEHQQGPIYDRRSQETPDVPLVRLPCEPAILRSQRYIRKGHFPFLKLPGELRNRIYDYAISKELYIIEWLNHNQRSKSLTYKLSQRSKLHGPQLPPDAARRRRLLDIHRRKDSRQHLSEDSIQPSPAVLLLVCRKISEEAASVFYSKSMFYFHGLGCLRHFLDNLRPIAMTSVRRLSLRYRAYGNPAKTEHQCWKEKHDQLWESLCWRITDGCSLTHLDLDLTLNKSPVSFASFDQVHVAPMGTQWIRPLWAFQDAGIQRCWGHIRCTSQPDTVLEVESWKMRKEILGEMWDEEFESSRDAYGFEKSRKKALALIL